MAIINKDLRIIGLYTQYWILSVGTHTHLLLHTSQEIHEGEHAKENYSGGDHPEDNVVPEGQAEVDGAPSLLGDDEVGNGANESEVSSDS